MKFDIKQAFTYMFQDKKLSLKLLIGYFIVSFIFLFNFIPSFLDKTKIDKFVSNNIGIGAVAIIILLLLIVFLILAYFAYCGYYFANSNLRMIKPNEAILDWTNFKYFLSVGFKNSIASLLYFLLFISCAIILLYIFKSSNIILYYMIVLFGICYFIGASISFTTDLKIVSFFDLKKIYQVLFVNFLNLTKFVLWNILVTIFLFFAVFILGITIVGILLVPLVIFYFLLIYIDLTAQLLRYVFKLEEKVE